MHALDIFACPVPDCDCFPYDTAQDLADHLLRDHGPAPAPVASQPAPAPAHRTPPPGSAPGRDRTTVRSFSPGGTRATVAPSAPSRPNVKPCTEKQQGFVRSLCARKGAELPDFSTLSGRDASKLIDRLLSQPDVESAPTAPAVEPAPEGFHLHDGTVYKVQVSKTGNRYAKVLVVPDDPDENAEWTYVGKKPLAFLSADTVATLEQAQEFGWFTVRCMCCGHKLENPESRERGIGPVCFGKYF